MIRLGLLFLMLTIAPAAAQQAAPRAFVELEKDSTIVGQPIVLRVAIVVPTWMPKPPEFPNVEVPGLIVRLPERASSPVSRTIDGDTWSGVQRSYRLYPLVPGQFDIPRQTVIVRYAEPGSIDPVAVELSIDGVSITAVVPAAARALDPLIIASGFTLEAIVEGGEDLAVGGAVTRTLTATIDGTTPILIPALSPDVDEAAVRAYPDEPKVTEVGDGRTLSGTRVERVSYVATAPGEFRMPAVAFDWFNVETGAVETVSVDAQIFAIAEGAQTTASDVDPADVLRIVLIAALVLLAAYLGQKYLVPRLRDWLHRLSGAWHASEHYAHTRVVAAIQARNLDATYTTLLDWARRHPHVTAADRQEIVDVLARIGARRFAAAKGQSGGWGKLFLTYERIRAKTLKAERQRRWNPGLQPLNPTAR